MSYSMTAEQFAQRIAKTALLRQRAVSAEAERDQLRADKAELILQLGISDAINASLAADRAELLNVLEQIAAETYLSQKALDIIAKHEAGERK